MKQKFAINALMSAKHVMTFPVKNALVVSKDIILLIILLVLKNVILVILKIMKTIYAHNAMIHAMNVMERKKSIVKVVKFQEFFQTIIMMKLAFVNVHLFIYKSIISSIR